MYLVHLQKQKPSLNASTLGSDLIRLINCDGIPTQFDLPVVTYHIFYDLKNKSFLLLFFVFYV